MMNLCLSSETLRLQNAQRQAFFPARRRGRLKPAAAEARAPTNANNMGMHGHQTAQGGLKQWRKQDRRQPCPRVVPMMSEHTRTRLSGLRSGIGPAAHRVGHSRMAIRRRLVNIGACYGNKRRALAKGGGGARFGAVSAAHPAVRGSNRAELLHQRNGTRSLGVFEKTPEGIG